MREYPARGLCIVQLSFEAWGSTLWRILVEGFRLLVVGSMGDFLALVYENKKATICGEGTSSQANILKTTSLSPYLSKPTIQTRRGSNRVPTYLQNAQPT